MRWPPNTITAHEALNAFGDMPNSCPFCRSLNVGLCRGLVIHVTCGSCGADGPTVQHRDNPRLAINLWNRRATQPTSTRENAR